MKDTTVSFDEWLGTELAKSDESSCYRQVDESIQSLFAAYTLDSKGYYQNHLFFVSTWSRTKSLPLLYEKLRNEIGVKILRGIYLPSFQPINAEDEYIVRYAIIPLVKLYLR